MKLVIREYLASLKERGELDAILPDLLSQMGLNVFSRPGRGTRQAGVDVGAVGSIDGGQEKVYLFTIKPGDLTRASWSANSPQNVRPSLDEIQDVYIQNRLPTEHRGKEIAICICCGGDIQEQVRDDLRGYCSKQTKDGISFEEWNGDKLADLIQDNFLREDLLPNASRSLFRKSLALLDEPQASCRHFSQLIASISEVDDKPDAERLTALRQISLCLWVLYAWSRDHGNLESAYQSAEIALLHGWSIARNDHGRSSKQAEAIQHTFVSVLSTYLRATSDYLAKCVLPHVRKQHGLSSAVRASNSLDVNLKLFDVLGRLGIGGLWAYWCAAQCSEESNERKQQLLIDTRNYFIAVGHLIGSNPALLLPIKDDQAIDVSIALLLSSFQDDAKEFIDSWLSEILGRATFAYSTHGHYPSVHHRYSDLLEHPKRDDEYRKNATSGSVLYPMMALYAALYDIDDLYHGIADFKREHLGHCNFQFWFPDESSEALIYKNSDVHGATASHVSIHRTKQEFIKEVHDECRQSPQFKKLSAVAHGMWPVVLVACRHYRLPIPLHLVESMLIAKTGPQSDEA